MTLNMKTYIINLQSISDIITNSSSEVFVLDTKDSINKIYDLIKMNHKIDPEDDSEIFDVEVYIPDEDDSKRVKAMGVKNPIFIMVDNNMWRTREFIKNTLDGEHYDYY